VRAFLPIDDCKTIFQHYRRSRGERSGHVFRDFNGLPVPGIRGMVESHIEDGKKAPKSACVRNFTLAADRSCAKQLDRVYSIDEFRSVTRYLETPQPISNHSATLQLRLITDGDRTYAEWTASFDAPAGEEADKLAARYGPPMCSGGFNGAPGAFHREILIKRIEGVLPTMVACSSYFLASLRMPLAASRREGARYLRLRHAGCAR